MRIMAIDYGDARTGVAVSDRMGLLTGYTTVIQSRRADETAGEIARLTREHGVGELVMGFPRNMDGSESLRADRYREFAKRLETETGLPVRLWDERRTTIDAHQILFNQGKDGRKRKKIVDAMAASLILENYLDYKRIKRE